MKQGVLIYFFFLIAIPHLKAQIMESGDVFDKITGIINSLPGEGSNEYTDPTMQEQTDWLAMLDDLFPPNPNYANAAAKADALGYDLIEFSDNITNETYYILEEDGMSNNYWGTYVLNPNACRWELVLMAPHPKKDFNTGKQAIYCFQQLDAYFFMLAGTNRCNHTSYSTCTGTTKICSANSENYRISDLAHVTEAIWQQTTEFVFDNITGTYFVQLHGFTKEPTDPYVIMSNGTRVTPAPDKIDELQDELLIVDPILTFKIAHIDLAWDRLIGFANTNGRYINGSVNVCNTDAVGTNGRFLHVEQEKFRLRNDIVGWNRMGVALGEAFNAGGCPSLTLLPVELTYFTAEQKGMKVELEWETASEVNHDYFAVEKSLDGNTFYEIGIVTAGEVVGTSTRYSFLDMPADGRNYYRLRQVDLDGSVTYSKTEVVDVSGDTGHFNIFYQKNELVVELFQCEPCDLILFNQIGQMVMNYPISGTPQKVPLPDLPQGIYFYKVKNGVQQLHDGKLWLH